MRRGLIALLTAVFLAGIGTAQAADILIGWDNAADTGSNVPVDNEAPDHVYVAGFAGAINGGRQGEVNNGSIDGTYGPLTPSNTLTNKGRYEIRGDGGTGGGAVDDRIAVTITNTTGLAYDLDALVFDFTRLYTGSPQGFDVRYKATLSANSLGNSDTNLLSVSGLSAQGPNTDWPDYTASIAVLADNTLAHGESATFWIYARDATGTGVAGVDNIAFTGTEFVGTLPATFIASPSELEVYVEDASGVVTGNVAVSYIEGTTPPTNVTVSVTIVSQSHSNAFANVNDELPLILNSPAPSSEVVRIEFDNSVAGLDVGQVATGIVEIVWSEPEFASVTSTVPVSATYLPINEGNIIALFDDSFVNADHRLGGLVAQISGGNGVDNAYGSDDGSYGSLLGNAPTEGGVLKVTKTSVETLTPVVAITNNTGSDVVLDSLHFDILKRFNKTPGAVNVTISGAITDTLLLDSASATNFTVNSANLTDYDDFDVPLTNLTDRTLEHGEGLVIEFAFIDDQGGGSPTHLDNIALLGSGSNGAVLGKAPGGDVNMGVTSFDTTVSELIEMFYTEGDSATNIVFNSVSFTNESHVGAFGYSGLSAGLSTPETTNEVVTVVFSNTVANLAAGEEASATMLLSWTEAGLAERVFEMDVYAARPADVSAGVVALFHTDFSLADAAIDGILGKMELGSGLDEAIGSNDGTYGSLGSPAAPTDASAWGANSNNPVITLTVTNKSDSSIVLSSLNFDIGRRWITSPTNCTVSVSGNVSADPALLEIINLPQQDGALSDFEDYNVTLTNLVDNTLGTGESVVFTFTFEQSGNANSTYLDNIALMTVGGYANWAASKALTLGVNDGPGDNPDGDGSDNLMEYATNGDPLTPDSVATMWQAEEGETDWFYHVYAERTDDDSLSYEVGVTENLVHIPATNAVSFVGESTVVDSFKTVTNRTDITEGVPAEFIRLKVDQN